MSGKIKTGKPVSVSADTGKGETMKLKKFGATEQKVYELVKPITDELEYFLWDVCYVREGAYWYLKIFIDRDEGITIEDCEKVNEYVGRILDAKDPIPQYYVLVVGSAGLERELLKEEHFEAYIGDEVRLRFIRPVDGEKEIRAVLEGYSKDGVTVSRDGSEQFFNFADIAFIKLWFSFD